VTLALLLLPVAFFIVAFTLNRLYALPALFLLLISAWVWLWFRPTHRLHRRSRRHRDRLAPVPSQDPPRHHHRRPPHQSPRAPKRDRALRVGAGGLWGGFGILWTARRGIVRMYVSRLDDLIWIERGREQPWLITPEQPDAFIHALSHQ
jgi:hypothetical protein